MNAESSRADFLARRGRSLIIVGAVLFAVSTAFPILAAISPQDTPPTWIGVFDVALAFVLVLVAMTAEIVTRGGR